MSEELHIPKPFGPVYPNLGVKVAKLRCGNDRKAHGEAVLEAILSKQRSECRRTAAALPSPNCASGTALQCGAAILKAVRAQNAAKVRAASPNWYDNKTQQKLYDAAMEEKRARS